MGSPVALPGIGLSGLTDHCQIKKVFLSDHCQIKKVFLSDHCRIKLSAYVCSETVVFDDFLWSWGFDEWIWGVGGDRTDTGEGKGDFLLRNLLSNLMFLELFLVRERGDPLGRGGQGEGVDRGWGRQGWRRGTVGHCWALLGTVGGRQGFNGDCTTPNPRTPETPNNH